MAPRGETRRHSSRTRNRVRDKRAAQTSRLHAATFLLRAGMLGRARCALRHPRACWSRPSSSRSSVPPSPYEQLGVARTATAAEIKAAYRDLAKLHHPDVAGDGGDGFFARVSAAYEQLRDPSRRAALDESLRRPERVADEAMRMMHAALGLAKTGRVTQGLQVFLGAAPLLDDGGEGAGAAGPAGGARGAKAGVAATSLASKLLEACAARGEPHHAQTAAVWQWLMARGEADARAANSYFSIALRGGHAREAMAAHRHAEGAGLEQSALMRSTVRQLRTYRRETSTPSSRVAAASSRARDDEPG